MRSPTKAPKSLSTAAMQVDQAPADCVDVTRENVEEFLPLIEQALDESEFFSFDNEMTGLFVDGVREEFLDEPSDRYAKLRESSHQYVINQFGLSCFAQDKAGGGWVAKTFNLYVFPEPLSKDVNSKKFLCDAGSLSFLAGNGFDFTKWITKGIPFMPAKERKEKIEAALKTYEIKGKKADREPVVPNDKAYIDFLTSFTLQLQFFINSSDDKTLLTDEMNGFKRLLAFQEIEKLKLGATVFVKKIETSNGYARLELTKGSPEEVKAMQDDDVARQISRINSASAFTRVLEVMRESGKPAVGHNCNFDVAYLMAIVEKKLPQKWEDYKALVQHWFPGGVYDTKHIARGIPEVFNGWTGLGDCFKAVTEEETEGYVRARAFLAAAGGSSAVLPSLSHAPGFTKYEKIEAGGLAHEAGYDAYMTGAVFAHLVPLVRAKASLSDDQDDPLFPLRSYKGKLNTMKSDIPHTNLFGPDAPLVRPNVFFVSAAPPPSSFELLSTVGSEEELRADDVLKLFQGAGLSQPRPKLTLWNPQASGGGNGGRATALGWLVEVDSSLSPLVASRLGEDVTRMTILSGSEVSIRLIPWEKFAIEKASMLAAAESKAVRPAKRQRVEIEPLVAAELEEKPATIAVKEQEKKSPTGCCIM